MIRQEESKDNRDVFNLIKSAFSDLKISDHDEQDLVERLRLSDAFIPELSLVAELDGNVIGHILFTKIKVGDMVVLTLAPLAVLPSMQGKGVGTALMIEGHRIACDLGFDAVIVVGHEDYYPRVGYVPASDYGINMPFDVPDESFMVLDLSDNGLEHLYGVVEFPLEFFPEGV